MFLKCTRQENSELVSTNTLVDHIHNFIKTIFLNFFHYILFLTILPNGVKGLKDFFFDPDASLNPDNTDGYSINKDKLISYVKEIFLKENGKELNYTKAEEYCFTYIFSPINDCIYY